MDARYFEDLVIGETVISPGRTITEADVVAFSGLSGDFSPLHTDEEAMKNSIYKTRIAHGQLALAIQGGLGQRALQQPVHTIALLGIKEWNFRKPIFFLDTIRVRITIDEKKETSRPDRGIVYWRREILNQRDEVVQEGFTVTMVKRRPQDAA